MTIDELLTRGVGEIIVKESLEKKLKGGKKLRIKLGVDPTAPDLHLGHAVVLRKLQEFQELGHEIVFLIGDYTSKIGDPSGRNKTRPILSDEQIEQNTKTYLNQVGKILSEKVTVIKNSEWFEKMSFTDFLKMASQVTVQSIIERDDFSNRLKKGSEIFFHELFYPIMQAYDSVMLKADVEIGGTDQKFNLLTGRELMKKMNLEPQDIITMPILVGLDGKEKMSKSLGNYIAINDTPDDIFGKVMSIPDNLIFHYFELCTDITGDALKIIEKEVKENPRDAKAKLAKLIVEMYHSEADAEKAAGEFDRIFKNKEKPTDIEVKKAQTMRIDDMLVFLGMASSKSEARRLIEQGAVFQDDKKITDPYQMLDLDTTFADGTIIKSGRNYIKVIPK